MRVLIADDHVHIRQGLQALLAAWSEIEVGGVAASSVEILQLVEKCQPDVVLMDIPKSGPAVSETDGVDRLEAIRLIKSRWPQVRIVMLMMYTTLWAVALAAGANAFLLKGCPAEALRDALLKAG